MQALADLLVSHTTLARFVAKDNAGNAGPLSCAAQCLLPASCNIVTLGNTSTNRDRQSANLEATHNPALVLPDASGKRRG